MSEILLKTLSLTVSYPMIFSLFKHSRYKSDSVSVLLFSVTYVILSSRLSFTYTSLIRAKGASMNILTPSATNAFCSRRALLPVHNFIIFFILLLVVLVIIARCSVTWLPHTRILGYPSALPVLHLYQNHNILRVYIPLPCWSCPHTEGLPRRHPSLKHSSGPYR